MLHKKLIEPKSIVVIGGSDNVLSPGGKVLKNLIDHQFKGELLVVNPKKENVQGIKTFNNVADIPDVDMAIIAIAAKYVPETIKILTQRKNTRGFIIFSAGFSEKDKEGAVLEKEIVNLIDQVGGSLLGPNNIGLINQNYVGVFTTPIPKLDKKGVDFISGSGATAVFFIEAANSTGLTFSSVYTVGNSAQVGVEEILEYLDNSYDKEESSKVKLLYIESIKNPKKFLKHTRSLIKKGCKIAAIKAGSSEEGSRAASSHTGAMASSNVFVETLFEKAGIIRCYGRNELITVAGILIQKQPKGKNIAIITREGGPAVMLTDVLSKNGLKIPVIKGKHSEQLLKNLHNGSSVTNPIDFLATGTPEQLETIIEYCDKKIDNIDAIIIISGSPGLTTIYDAYNIIDNKIKTSKKPIYVILPSVVNVKNEISEFITKGNIASSDEVLFGSALAKVYNTPAPNSDRVSSKQFYVDEIRDIIDTSENGYLTPEKSSKLLTLSGIDFVKEYEVKNKKELIEITKLLKYPVVQKVVGPLHKSDVGGVILNVKNEDELFQNFQKLMKIKDVTSVLIQPMTSGIEIFIGAKKESNFPHVIMAGLGGIFIEVLKDVQSVMIPVSKEEALKMIKKLNAFPILKGIRGQKGINLEAFAEAISNLSGLLQIVPEIVELDINPLLASDKQIIAVDVRIRIEK